MHQCEEVGYYAFYFVGYIYLVAVELYLVALHFDVALYLGEVEHTGEVEGEVYVEVYPEEGLVAHGVELAVEFLVILVLELCGFACPQRGGVVDDVVL